MKLTRFFCGLAFLVLCANGAESQMISFNTSCGNSSTLDNLDRFGQSCRQLLSAWFYTNIRPYNYGYRLSDAPLDYQANTTSWTDICRWGQTVGRCYDLLLPQCDAGIGIELVNNPKFIPSERVFYLNCEFSFYERASSLQAFYRRTCQGEAIKQDIQQRIDDVNFDANTTCLNSTELTGIHSCFAILIEEVQVQSNVKELYQTSEAIRVSFNRMAAATVNCMFSAINRSPCNEATKRVMYHVAKLQLPSFIDETELDLDDTTTADFSSVIRCTVGVYGDPHMRLCDRTSVTCAAPGQQVYIDNKWFTVTGTNEVIGTRRTNPPPTSLRSIVITFRSLASGDVVATYTSQGGNLPTVFDGTNSASEGQGNDQVTVDEGVHGRRLFIQASTGMVLTLRQWAGNYFFTLRVAQNVIKNSHGLLASGCPSSQTINRVRLFQRPAVRRKRAVTLQECQTACNDSVTESWLREICEFDCYATDDIEFGVNMTVSAQEDNVAVVEMDADIIANFTTAEPTTPKPTTPMPNNTPRPNGQQTTKNPNSASRISLNLLLSTAVCLLVPLLILTSH